MAKDLSWNQLAERVKLSKESRNMDDYVANEMESLRKQISAAMRKGESSVCEQYPTSPTSEFLHKLNEALPDGFSAMDSSTNEGDLYMVMWPVKKRDPDDDLVSSW